MSMRQILIPILAAILTGGKALAVLALGLMVIFQVGAIIARSMFGWTEPWLGELVTACFAITVAAACAATLIERRHVAIDLLDKKFGVQGQRAIEITGALLLLFPLMAVVLWAATPWLSLSWSVMEGSATTGGLPGVFLIKSAVVVFAFLMLCGGLHVLLEPRTEPEP